MPGPADPELNRRWRQARRQLAREMHPDRGGSADAYTSAAAHIDDTYAELDRTMRHHDADGGVAAAVHTPVSVTFSWRSRGRGPRRNARKALRRAQNALPRWVPGSRRYTEL